ncbi:ABC transporter permease [Weissella hellenica]|uniref:ABC transporter permease n=1 Tax=Weissella hellenica TaxID=46256 RepID=UPI0038864EC9
MIILKLLLFGLSLAGYRQVMTRLGGNRYLSWLLAIVVQSLMIYFAALAGYLTISIWIVFYLGLCLYLVLFVEALCNKNIHFNSIHVFDIWFIIFGTLFAFTLYHSSLIHYDNFSHWATMVKYLHFVGELPTAGQNLVTFTDYPPATAIFLAYFTAIVGYQEGLLLVGQFIIIWAGLYTLFGMLRDQKRVLMTVILLLVISFINILNISIRFNNLLVDCVLAVLGVAGITAVFINKNHHAGWQIISTSLIVNFLLLTKSSAIYFAILILIYFGISVLSEAFHSQNKIKMFIFAVLKIVITTAISFFGWLCWRWHVAETFSKLSKHALSVQAYQNQANQESTHTKDLIIQKFLAHLFNIDTLFLQSFLLINLVLLISWLIIRFLFHKTSYSLRILLVSDLITIMYIVGLLGMYLVSMPYSEAITLAGIDRYLSTIVIFIMLIASVVMLNDFDRASFEPNIQLRNRTAFASLRTKQIYQESTFIIFLLGTVLMLSEINGINYLDKTNEYALPKTMQRIIPNISHFNHEKVLIVDPVKSKVDNAYTKYVGRYYLFSDQVDGREAFNVSPQEFKYIIKGYHYVVIPSYHQTFTKLAHKTYHSEVKTGIYKVDNDGLHAVSASKYMSEVN